MSQINMINSNMIFRNLTEKNKTVDSNYPCTCALTPSGITEII